MHLQAPPPGWTDALVKMPDGALVKAFDPGLLTDARAKWAAAGRDQSKLTTILRHFDVIYPFDRPYSWAEHKDIWRVNFARFIDGTYLAKHVANVSAVETLNEHTDSRMVTDKELLRPHLLTEQAAVSVWEETYRGKIVPASCRLVILNSPVGNDVAREFYNLAVNSNSILGLHPYSKWANKQRDPQDFRFHSGRWNVNEQEYGLFPDYAFTECGPYFDAAQGWRSSTCMGGDAALLVAGMRAWVRDVAGTAAYREGRILGPGAFFTSGGGAQWAGYELETAQLLPLAQMLAAEWRPGTESEQMDEQTRKAIREHAQAIIALVDPPWWTTKLPPYKLAATGKMIPFYNSDGSRRTAQPTERLATSEWDVFSVAGDLLRVTNFTTGTPQWWVKADTVTAAGCLTPWWFSWATFTRAGAQA